MFYTFVYFLQSVSVYVKCLYLLFVLFWHVGYTFDTMLTHAKTKPTHLLTYLGCIGIRCSQNPHSDQNVSIGLY